MLEIFEYMIFLYLLAHAVCIRAQRTQHVMLKLIKIILDRKNFHCIIRVYIMNKSFLSESGSGAAQGFGERRGWAGRGNFSGGGGGKRSLPI